MPFKISSRNKVETKNKKTKLLSLFSMLQLKKGWDKRMFFFFYNKISFPFSFSCPCLMGMLKNTEYYLISKLFAEVFLIARIPHSTVLIYSRQREKAILWPIVRHKQNFFFKRCRRGHWNKNSYQDLLSGFYHHCSTK